MVIPYSTDSPIYHLPVATVLMIVVNIVVFVAYPFQEDVKPTKIIRDQDLQANEDLKKTIRSQKRRKLITEEQYEEQMAKADEHLQTKVIEFGSREPNPYILHYGRGYHPHQWISAHFLHINVIHLIGNLIWLWTFGILVEGKIGWWKFLMVYFGMAIGEGFIEQSLLLGADPVDYPGSLGASSVIFGLVAISLIWAPANDVNCVFLIVVYPIFFTAPVAALSGFYVIWSAVWAMLLMGDNLEIVPTTEFLHALGAVVGFGVGIAMLKLGLVDCEGWDAFSCWGGQKTTIESERTEDPKLEAAYREKESEQIQAGLSQIREIINSKQNPKLAYRAHIKMRQKFENWHLPEPEFLALIKQLSKAKLNEELMLAIKEYLIQGGEREDKVRLKYASLLIERECPSQALAALEKIDQTKLDESQRMMKHKLMSKSKKMKDEGVIDTLDQ